ncbi:MAG: ABC transporter ATP-binding protein [Cyanobacteria bacterium J06623_4]
MSLRKKEFCALQNVSFQLKRGEAIALIGRNGSGKSTLLRIITGLIKPDAGTVTVTGRIAPLIALGAGFNPILTGRENIYANMSVLGLTKQQIEARFDDVVAFAEIDSSIDAPVQSYSSGMAARLGFACAVYTEPDILVIDEVLAVGDVQFRFKCFRRLAELRRKGIAFILVSHNTNSVLSLCESAVYLQDGMVQAVGRTSEVMKIYENDALISEETATTMGKMTFPPRPADKSLGADITGLFFKDASGNEITTLLSGEPATYCMRCKIHRPLDDVRMVVVINSKSSEDGRMLSLSNSIDKIRLSLAPGNNIIEMHMPYVGLPPGTYTMSTNVRQGPLEIMDSFKGFEFKVENKLPISECRFYQPRDWRTATLEVATSKVHATE